MVKEIDKHLRQSVEIQEVYEEILKSTPKDHLVFHKVCKPFYASHSFLVLLLTGQAG